MTKIFLLAQIILSPLLIFLILIQSRESGFVRSWKVSASSFTRRGLEKVVFKLTFVVAALFIIISILRFTL
ncbi:preprotein translocase subunit SecG [Candidatus Woesebacteria bacterium RIFCSPHIGHO2_01_FULL_38_10]|uniref:Protein-export membrane protein SecG n=1 Tax=Candidatus Woesebacteria bacterium RIFCSPLOWO2_01_FULL_39_10b TaxID=1802517 RepID=A0A1F8B610_9BACT|nr:MAG: preprotein translocase subunit SecG [Candidatus Woesebacteria bacterium RIFCSPHIGHO2_01_FULL_38_10]OGM59484.1 MAG: preprotein translocase subunit SecG [Candidatus Woesebacteria bacterium RIFCSPLOWO2_01_FULL_39_10b]